MDRVYKLFLVVLLITLFSQWLGFEIAERTTNQIVMISITAGIYTILFLCLFGFVKHDGINSRKIGYRVTTGWKGLLASGICIGLFLQLILFLLLFVTKHVDFYFSTMSAGTFVYLVVVGALFVAVVEEGIFRGYILRNLTKEYTFLRALLLSSALFAIIHVPFVTIYKAIEAGVLGFLWPLLARSLLNIALIIFPLGILLGYSYLKSKNNLIAPIAFHAALNASGLFILSYSTQSLVIIGSSYELLIVLYLTWVAISVAVVWGINKARILVRSGRGYKVKKTGRAHRLG